MAYILERFRTYHLKFLGEIFGTKKTENKDNCSGDLSFHKGQI